jgi:hypothetical protein
MTLRLRITPTEFIAGDFDATSRYIRGSASGARFPIPKNATINMAVATTGTSQTFYFPALRYSVNGVVRQRTKIDDNDTSTINPGSYNSTVVLVKT